MLVVLTEAQSVHYGMRIDSKSDAHCANLPSAQQIPVGPLSKPNMPQARSLTYSLTCFTQVADDGNMQAIEDMQLRLHHRAVIVSIGAPAGPVTTMLAHMAARGMPARGAPFHVRLKPAHVPTVHPVADASWFAAAHARLIKRKMPFVHPQRPCAVTAMRMQ
jgi:hypothetical protein